MKTKVAPQIKKSNLVKSGKEKPITIVAIGASAGGLEAMSELLKNLPPTTGMAYIYVQHLSPDHKSFLTSILSKITDMKVQEIEDLESIAPDNVYIIPPNKGIQVTDGRIKLLPRSKAVTAISIDVLFASLALTYKKNVIGVILSGYASDGMMGLKAIKDAGGVTFAQDDSAQASSMPNAAIASGVVDFILSPEEIAQRLILISKNGLPEMRKQNAVKEVSIENGNEDLNTIFGLLLTQTGVDFSHYKLPTLKRRLNHKMIQSGVKTLKAYLNLLVNNRNEITSLYNDFLINVTSFMRDKEVFNYLKSTFLPKLYSNKAQDETLRIWVPACATGEEVYSLAMLIRDLQKTNSLKIPVKIFGTDVSEPAISKARIGEYSEIEIGPLSKKHRELYLGKFGTMYRITKDIRDMCVFAPHNILRDPPFSKMDFISCRNLLIYLDAAAQRKVFSTLYFALNDKGYIMLGKAETTGTASVYFGNTGNKFKIFSKKKNSESKKSFELIPRFPATNLITKKAKSGIKSSTTIHSAVESAMDAALLSQYVPACVVVNKDFEILQMRGPVSKFLLYPQGKASLNILKMSRPEFTFELRNAITKSLKSKQKTIKSDIEITINAYEGLMSIEVSHLNLETGEPLLLIVFGFKELAEISTESKVNGNDKATQKDKKIKKLTAELNATRIEMNTIIEAQERTYEDLQAANEEIVSSNEEFQTLNEELETSKEEIEATNEELVTSNNELQIRNELLSESQEYSEAIIATIHEPMLILSQDLRVKTANKTFYEKFQVTDAETEGQYLFDLGNQQWNIQELKDVLKNIFKTKLGFENFEVIHNFQRIGEKILLLNANLIVQKLNNEELVLLAIEDITERTKYHLQEKHSLSLIEASLDPLITIDTQGKITDLNEAAVKITGEAREKLIGTVFFDHFTDPQKAREIYERVFEKGSLAESPLTLLHKNGELTDMLFSGSVYKDEKGIIVGEVIVARDVTIQNKNAKELIEAKEFAELATELALEAKLKAEDSAKIAENAMKAKQQFLSNMSHEIRTPMNAIVGFTKVLQKTELNDKQKEYLSAIKMSSDTLIVLINDILDLAKIDSGKIVFEQTPFKLAISLAAMAHLFETRIKEKNLQLITSFDYRIPEVLVGDSIRLHQILLNLMSNAVKFTHKGSISLKATLASETKDIATIAFSVSDTGIGIDESKLDNIFENFQQASNDTTRLYGGTGLGLAIAKQLVEAQGGRILVKSKINKGSVFSFVLNFHKTDSKIQKETEELENYQEFNNIKVLVVEDIPLNQLLMKTLLEDFSFQYDIVSNGKEAIEILLNNSYDIILMDLQMPEMNGFEATNYIRKKMHSNIPIIALTADVTTVDLEKCKAVGMNDYLAKPIEEKLLYAKILDQIKTKFPPLTNREIESSKAIMAKHAITNIEFLTRHTKNNPTLIMEMITLFLKQTPPLISTIKLSLAEQDMIQLGAAAHKLIPSFSIMGIHSDYELMAKTIQKNAESGSHLNEIPELVMKLENVCSRACIELQQELQRIEISELQRN